MPHQDRNSTTRRAVVAGLAAAAGSVAIAAHARALAPRTRAAKTGLEQWPSLGDRTFRVAAENGPCALSLVTVRGMPAGGPRPAACSRPYAFAAVFEAPAAGLAPVGDRAYAVQHPELGTFPLFLGAPSREGGKLRFVAIFN